VTVLLGKSAATVFAPGSRGIIRDYRSLSGVSKEWAARLPLAANSGAELRSLAERIRQGVASAETELVQEFTQRIFVMAVVRTHDREAARELVQDVLMAVIGALRKGQLHDSDKLAAFIHGTARNLINNRLRAENQKPQMESISEDLPQVNLAEQLEDAERMRLVQEALEHLGEEDRKILLMTLVEGRKPGEIAAALRLTAEVVRTRKLRALRKVADLIRKRMSRT
jgi:RNA polymerase sigma factor (sigma-70 family)